MPWLCPRNFFSHHSATLKEELRDCILLGDILHEKSEQFPIALTYRAGGRPRARAIVPLLPAKVMRT